MDTKNARNKRVGGLALSPLRFDKLALKVLWRDYSVAVRASSDWNENDMTATPRVDRPAGNIVLV
jgi:hypothetical protein